MLALLGRHQPEFLFMELFLQQLPLQVRSALANSRITDCRELAEEADKFFLAGQQHCAAVQKPAQDVWLPAETAVVAAAEASQRRGTAGLCYYHARFGPRATRCRSPCSYSKKGNAGAGAQ